MSQTEPLIDSRADSHGDCRADYRADDRLKRRAVRRERRLAPAALALTALLAGCAGTWQRETDRASSAAGDPTASTSSATLSTAATIDADRTLAPRATSQRVQGVAPPLAGRAESAPPPVVVLDAEAQRRFDEARIALANGHLAQAERGFSALARSHPQLAGPLANRALVHRREGRLDAAVEDLQRALDRVQAQPQARAELLNELGITLRMAGRFGEARSAYEQALALVPAHGGALLNLAILHDLYLWDRATALALYERWLRQAGSGADATQADQVQRWIADLRQRGDRGQVASSPGANRSARQTR